jgi:protein-S-isoprenylcysteine O-methyltransferase Ste14
MSGAGNMLGGPSVSHYLFFANPVWTAVFAVTYAAFFGVSMWAAGRERNLAKGENRDRGSKIIVTVFTFLGMGAAFVLPWYAPQARIALPPLPVFATAIAMVWLGVAVYTWAVRTLGTSFRTSVTLLDGQRLITKGPYRILRHPAYTGGILILSGIGLAIGNWLSFATMSSAAVIAYGVRIRVEEAALRERFGAEFDANRNRTWAVIPLVW